MAEASPEILAASNCAYWTHLYKIQLQAEPFTFLNHQYLSEPLESQGRVECTIKATQGGFTESEVLRCLHDCIYNHTPKGILYLFPTDDDVLDFSKTRFNTLIQNNPESIGKFVKTGGKGTDSAALKKVGNAFIYFRSGRLSKTIGANDAKEASQLRSIPVDAIRFDEYDLMDEEICEKAKGRLRHSTVKMERYLSNPTIPGFGIDRLFRMSDQRHWFRKCSACNEWTCAELEFPNCVKADEKGLGYIACKRCGKPVGIYPGKWIPLYKDKSIIGRRWSQLTSIYNDPLEILNDYYNPRDGNIADVMRLRLGEAYVDIEDKLRPQDVYAACTGGAILNSSSKPCAMGVDVGKKKHVVIGWKIGQNEYEIIWVGAVDKFNDVHDLARRFNVRSAVVDIRPYEDEARAFQKAEHYTVHLCEYTENATFEQTLNEKTGTYKVHRTSIFDATGRMIRDGNFIFPRRCPTMDEFAIQLCNTAKRLEKNKRSGVEIFRYVKLGDEHFRNALNYFFLASRKVQRVKSKFESAAPTRDCQTSYKLI